MIGSTIFDISNFTYRLDEVYKDDKQHKEDCGWDERDLIMIAEGMLQATQTLAQMQLEAHQEKKEYREVIHAHWIKSSWIEGEHRKYGTVCSNCNEGANSDNLYGGYYASTYCPYCGARMDGDEK